jgi:hypothetical protein
MVVAAATHRVCLALTVTGVAAKPRHAQPNITRDRLDFLVPILWFISHLLETLDIK